MINARCYYTRSMRILELYGSCATREFIALKIIPVDGFKTVIMDHSIRLDAIVLRLQVQLE